MHNNSPIITLPRQGRAFLGGKGDGGALGLGTPIVFYVLGMGLWGPEGDVCDFCFFNVICCFLVIYGFCIVYFMSCHVIHVRR